MITIKKMHALIMGLTFISGIQAAMAEFIKVDAQATYTGTNASVLSLIPAGTTVTTSVQFEVGPGSPQVATVSGGFGTFNWDNGGPQVHRASGIFHSGTNASGELTFDFPGTGPTIGGFTTDRFQIVFDIGMDPFTTTLELSDLLLDSSISRLRVGAMEPGFTSFDNINDTVSGTITLVPEPSGFVLGCICLIGLGLARIVLPKSFVRKNQCNEKNHYNGNAVILIYNLPKTKG